MRFLWPDMLWALLAAPLLVGAYLYTLRRQRKEAIRFASLRLVRDALGRNPGLRRHVPPLLFLLAFVAGMLALSRPLSVVVLPTDHITLVLAMDVSRSMLATDVKPNRITAAQSAAKAFIADLPKKVRVGIVTFAGTAVPVQSPTGDRDALYAAIDRFELQRATATGSALLASLGMLRPDAGIDLEAAVFAEESGDDSPAAGGQRRAVQKKVLPPATPGSWASGAIILLSDGRRTTGPDPVEAAKIAADLGVRVHTVGFGTRTGAEVSIDDGWSFYARLDEDALKAVARITGAEYFHAGTAADLRKVYRDLSGKLGLEKTESEISALFGAAAAVLLLLAIVLSLAWLHARR